MKKQFIPILLLLAVFASCKKQSQVNLPSDQKVSKNNSLRPMSAGDGQTDVLGYGYDITGEYGTSSSAKFSVINVAALKADHPTRVELDQSTMQEGRLVAGDNAQSYLKQVSAKISSSLNIGIFKGTISGSYSDNDAFSSKYVYSSFSLIIQQKRLKINADYTLLKQYLQPSFLQDVQNGTPESIVNSYGTHVLTDFKLGAKLEALYRSETKKANRTVAATAGVDVSVKTIFSINTGYNYSLNDTYDNTYQTLHYRTYGGDPTKSLMGSVPLGGGMPTINISDWQSSATPENSELIDISTGGLIPIYELIDDPTKKAAVMTYVNQYLAANQVNVTPVPIHVFYQPNDINHVYTAFFNDYPYQQNGFTYLGTNFKAYASQIDGTQPVHAFYSPSGTNHTYTINRFDYPYEQNGYIYHGISFYAYTTQVPGSVPVHVFYHPGGVNHTYTINRYDYPYAQNGYQYLGVNFYAMPL